MPIDRRDLLNAAAGVGLAGAALAAGGAAAGPRQSHQGTASGHEPVRLAAGSETAQTAAIQTAIDAAASTGAPVLLPAGRFVVGPLVLRAGTRLIGAHGATVLVATNAEALLTGDGARDIALAGLSLDGDGRAGQLVRLERASGRIADCRFLNAADVALFANDSAGLSIAHNEVVAAGNNGIQIWRTAAGDDGTQVLFNRIASIASKAGGSGQNGNGVNVFRAGGVMVSGNVITDCAYSAVRGNAASNLQVLDNQSRRLGEVALYAEFGFEGAVISRNVVDGAAAGIAVTNFNEGGRLAVVQGNLVRNLQKRPQEPVDKRGEGISVEADTVVSGNVVESAESYGIAVGWGPHMRNVVVTGNIVRGADVGIGVTVDQGAGAVIVSDNLIDGARRGAIRGFRHGELVGDDLAKSETRTGRVRITGNLAV